MRLTVTFELGVTSVEAAMKAIDEWAASRFNGRGLHVLKVEAAGDGDPHIRALTAGHRLAERRRRLGISQHDLAKQARVPKASISRVELGYRGPHSATAIAMERALDAAEASR
ncbi:helix-turn-helix transcriptional regulator [Nonomuraea sp. NPDC050404]|uniref:helix-turn-helix domain-containing protein n=1 Tax=Nonomuraea sp. NPDC050404 TaxID=3155783 RepID=UPI003405C52E